jgi:adenosylcobinamide-GDP ribazoletransferase
LRRFLAAVAFLTRIPVAKTWELGAADVGRSAAYFSLVGAGIGAIQSLVLWASLHLAAHASQVFARSVVLPSSVVSVVITAIGVWITRGLHLDGLADMADGFGGGQTPEDILRIMRDHAIGSFGAIAVIIVLALKITSLAVLIERGGALRCLVLAPVLARGSIVILGFLLPYARPVEGGLGSSLQHIGRLEVAVSSIVALATLIFVNWRPGAICLVVVMFASAANARICMRRIGGVTGDTLGANVEVCEALILTAGSILAS